MGPPPPPGASTPASIQPIHCACEINRNAGECRDAPLSTEPMGATHDSREGRGDDQAGDDRHPPPGRKLRDKPHTLWGDCDRGDGGVDVFESRDRATDRHGRWRVSGHRQRTGPGSPAAPPRPATDTRDHDGKPAAGRSTPSPLSGPRQGAMVTQPSSWRSTISAIPAWTQLTPGIRSSGARPVVSIVLPQATYSMSNLSWLSMRSRTGLS